MPQPTADWGVMLTPENSAVALIDHQLGVAASVRSIDRPTLGGNAAALVKTAKSFGVPVVLAATGRGADASLLPELAAAVGTDPVTIYRKTRRNAWADTAFVQAIEATGRPKLVMAGLWTEVALTLTALSALEAGYEVYVVIDASGGTSAEAHATAIQRLMQAGAVPVTWLQVACEYLDAAETPEMRAAVRVIGETHAGALGPFWDLDE